MGGYRDQTEQQLDFQELADSRRVAKSARDEDRGHLQGAGTPVGNPREEIPRKGVLGCGKSQEAGPMGAGR